MLNRRQALQRAALIGIGAAVALRPGAARAQGGRKPALTIALPSNPETIDPHQFRSVLTGSILTNMCETLLTRDAQEHGAQAAAGHVVAQRQSAHVGVQAAARASSSTTASRSTPSRSSSASTGRSAPSSTRSARCCGRRRSARRCRSSIPRTVRITTKVPDPILPNRVAAESVSMVPPKAMADYREKFVSDRPIGTGPYRFVEYVVGDRVVMEANPDYWGAKPASQRIVWQIVPDAATRVAALSRGTVDVIAEPAGAADLHGGG